jgi:3-hydroxy-9,10-secoandrosta-1,3,5(10)-triene-9,17-dione monooxygenase reductase component
MPSDVTADLVDSRTFRAVLAHFGSGVAIVAGLDGETPVGYTCQSFMSLSLTPPLIAVAPSIASTSWPRIASGGSFTVSILSSEQESLARAFSVSGGDKFRAVAWSSGRTGAPRIADALGWVDCDIATIHEAGDHLLVIGAVRAVASAHGQPLMFYRAGFGTFRAQRGAMPMELVYEMTTSRSFSI